MKLNKYLPTGYPTIDILGGQNKRDLNGNLVEIQRGHRLGDQVAICASPGVGKTTLALDIASMGYHVGLPLWKIIYIDADKNNAEDNRYSKLTNFTDEEREKYLEVVPLNFMEDIVKYLNDVNVRYKAEKFKPVEIKSLTNPDLKMHMMPYAVVIIDTVTSLKSEKYSLGSTDTKADSIANQQGMTEGRLKGDIANSIANICDGNILVLWLSHLKKNTPEMGKTVAKKAYKSAPADIIDSLPEKIRAKVSFVYWLIKPADGNNQESSKHINYVFGYDDDEGQQNYQATIIAVKSRSAAENRSPMQLVYEKSKWNTLVSLLSTLYYNTDRLTKSGGMYPSADTPSVLPKEEGYKIPKREALKLKGYDRPTNLVEARKLLEYVGSNPEAIEAKNNFLRAALIQLEDYYAYELEANNLTYEDIKINKQGFTSLYGFISSIPREDHMQMEKLKEIDNIRNTKEVQDNLDYESI